MKYKELKATQALREKIWNSKTLSGSRFKKWLFEPENYLKKTDLSFIEEKLKWGNLLENVIFYEFTNKLFKEGDCYFNVKENIYQHGKYSFCYANIDGKVRIDGETCLVEIKNTETESLSTLINTYYYQMLYYSWFFEIKDFYFVALVNGCKMLYCKWEFQPHEWVFVEKMVNHFGVFVSENILLDFSKDVKDFDTYITKPDKTKTDGYNEIFKWYYDNQEKIKEWEAAKKDFEKGIYQSETLTDYFLIKKTWVEPTKVLDTKKIIEIFGEKLLKEKNCYKEKNGYDKFSWKKNK